MPHFSSQLVSMVLMSIVALSQAGAAAPKAAPKDKKAAPATTGPKIIASCDVPEVGSCFDFTDKAKEKSETLCASMQKKPAASACAGDYMGSCEFPEGYFRRFHKSGAEAWEPKAAQDDCKQRGGSWHP